MFYTPLNRLFGTRLIRPSISHAADEGFFLAPVQNLIGKLVPRDLLFNGHLEVNRPMIHSVQSTINQRSARPLEASIFE